MPAMPRRIGSAPTVGTALSILLLCGSSFAAAQECEPDGNSPATPVPKCVSAATSEAVACNTLEAVQLWPEGFRPGATIPRTRDSTSRIAHLGYPEESKGWWEFQAVKALNDRLYVAYTEGLQVWDIAGARAEEPFRLAYRDTYETTPSHFFDPIIKKGEVKAFFEDLDVIPSASGDLIALAGVTGMGPSFWKFTNGSLKLLYRDVNKNVKQFRTFEYVDSTQTTRLYAVGTGSGSGARYFYDLSAAAARSTHCISVETDNCPGIYLGEQALPFRFIDLKVVGDHLYLVAASPGANSKMRIDRYSLPLTPSSIANGSTIYTASDVGGDIHSPTFLTYNGNTYLGLVKDDRGRSGNASNRQVRIYDVENCLDAGGCTGLGTPLWTAQVPSHWAGALHLLTFSMSQGRPFLYSGTIALGYHVEGPALEGLYDLTPLTPDGPTSAIVEMTQGGGTYNDPCHGKKVDYWGRYYDGNSNGLRGLSPVSGVFNGNYFYRAAFTVLDVHVRGDGGGGGGTPHITTTVGTSGPYWFGVSVPFSASDTNCDGAGAWEWFSDNTTAIGLESTASSALVTWSLCGSTHCPSETAEVWALKADCADDPDLEETRANISLSDPRPVISNLEAFPKGTANVFPVCTQLQFSADVGGLAPMSRNWVVRAVEGGQEESLDSNTGTTLTWDTSGVTLGLLIDGFESGDFSRWSSVFGATAAATTGAPAATDSWAPTSKAASYVAPKAGASKDFEILLNVTNAHGTDTESIFVTLESLDAISFGSPAITVVDLGGGSYRFTAETSSATEWRWELEDPANGSDAECLVYDKCAFLDFVGDAKTIEYAWTPPNTSGDTFHITATAINCNDTSGVSREVSVTPAEITAPEPPTADSMAIDLAASPGCTSSLGNYECPVNQPITFTLDFSNANSVEIDWDGDNTWDQTVSVSGTSQQVQHTYTSAPLLSFVPQFRAKAGQQTSATRTMTGHGLTLH